MSETKHRERAERLQLEIAALRDECAGHPAAELHATVAAITAAFAEVEAEAAPRWIPVGERLPEESGQYIVHGLINNRHPIVTQSYYHKPEKSWGHTPLTVLGWQPLPSVPHD
jgi:hypothetical protein